MELSDILRQIVPCNKEKPYIFISYSSMDSEIVWRDVLEFQKRGYNVWLDEKNLDKTKDSWKKNALADIEDIYCSLLVFYVSSNSLISEACLNELIKTVDEDTVESHHGPIKFVAVDVENIGHIGKFSSGLYAKLMKSSLEKKEKTSRIRTLSRFNKLFFESNNERVRVHPQSEKNRKTDYYSDILYYFPEEARIYTERKLDSDQVFREKTTGRKTGTGKKASQQKEAQQKTTQRKTAQQKGVWEKEAESGILDADTQYRLGNNYYSGQGVRKDYKKAFEWYRKAAIQGHAAAQCELAYCYQYGKGTEKNKQSAIYWYKRAAAQGNERAMNHLGYCYEHGEGVELDFAKAVSYYRKALILSNNRIGEGCGIIEKEEKKEDD